MKNLLKIPILFIVLASSACRSNKTVESSTYSANDSCVVKTDIRILSLTDIEKNETISSRLAQDHIEFSDRAGEIRIHSNGDVSIKGLKSLDLMRHDTHKRSSTIAATNESLTVQSQSKTAKATDAMSKAMVANPTVSSIWLKILFFIGLIILLIISTRYVIKRFFN